MPDIGDRVRVESTKLGQAVREGVVTGVVGHMLRVQWSMGEESTFMPGPGSVRVVGKVKATKETAAPAKNSTRKAPARKAATSTKKSAKSVTKKATGKK
jgi:hypothetical protein